MDKKLNIGTMDKKVSIYQTTEARTETGEMEKTPVLYKSVWANVTDINSTESEDGKIYLVQIRDYNIRYDSLILTTGQTMFIREADGDYYITGIKAIGRKAFINLKAVKRE